MNTSTLRRRIFFAALVTAVLGPHNVPAALKTLPGHVPVVVAKLTPIGELVPTKHLHLAIGLPLRNREELQVLLRELYDPSSTNFQHYLTPDQFTEQFGPTEIDYEAVVHFAETNGLSVTHRHGNRVLLDVEGSVSDIERAFHVGLKTYRHPTEARNFYAPEAEPSVGEHVPIQDISGLSDFARPQPMLHRERTATGTFTAGGSSPGSGYIGRDFRNAYVPGTTLDGAGQMVGLFELAGYDPQDILAYESQAGLPNVPLQNVSVDGASGLPGDGEDEACLDIEMTIAMATNLAAVVVFEGLSSANWNDIFNTMAASNQIKQFSSSWGFSGLPNATLDGIFQQMAAQGQSVFQASGDGDAWTYTIWQPSASPYLTVVGGTTLFMNGSGLSYQNERVWNAGYLGVPWGPNGLGNYYWGSGGGVSPTYSIPLWQTGVNSFLTNGGSTALRNIPDVALTADDVYITHGSGTNGIYGGTSCAAPLWAGFMALVNQKAAASGRPAVGFINPAVYELANETLYGSTLHDITNGNNTWSSSPLLYHALPGYDLCTGLGTPAGTNLINALINPDPLVISNAQFNAVSLGGTFNLTAQVFRVSNAGTVPATWSLINTSQWLSASRAAGTLAPGAGLSIVLRLTALASNLNAGTYTANLWFTNATTGVAHSRFCTLVISPSIVQNGGFETADFTDWTLFGNTVDINNNYIYNAVESPTGPDHFDVAHSGNYGAFLGDTSLAILQQSVPTVPGQSYLLSFWLNNPVGGFPISGHLEQFEVNWNTNGVTNTIYNLQNPSAFTWTNVHLAMTATGTNAVLQFGELNQPNYFGLDDISAVAIPQPSFAGVSRVGSSLTLTWGTVPNVPYRIQYATDLGHPMWLNLGSAIPAATNTLKLTDTNALTISPRRFYRVVVSP